MQLDGMLIGLGNPGKEYANTRHNYGFMLVDELLAYASAQSWGKVEKLSSARQKFELWRAWLNPAPALPWLFLKPLTYMNLSGEAAAPVVAYYQLPIEQIIVAHDEMDLPLGRMRFKFGGGSAGHKGIKSLEQHFGSNEFYRLRLGIGKNRSDNAISHVIGPFDKKEAQLTRQVLEFAAKAIIEFKGNGFEETQQRINGFKLPEESAE